MDVQKIALSLAKTMVDYKGKDVVVLDLTEKNVWTDYFIIVTAGSATHAAGLEKYAEEAAEAAGLERMKTSKKIDDGDDWRLLDFNRIVIHIMSEVARNFYDLEKLWYDAKRIEVEAS